MKFRKPLQTITLIFESTMDTLVGNEVSYSGKAVVFIVL